MASLKTITKEWYNRLASEGFSDIENPDGSLKQERGSKYIRNSKDQVDINQEYYSLAVDYLNIAKLNKEERLIWALFCDGLSIRKIEDKTGIYRFKVHKIISEHKIKAGLKRGR